MTRRTTRFTPETANDISDACRWYYRQRPGLDDRFMAALDLAVALVADRPESFPEIGEGLRRARLDKFPYIVLFRVEPTEVEIVGVVHDKRDPKVSRDRA